MFNNKDENISLSSTKINKYVLNILYGNNKLVHMIPLSKSVYFSKSWIYS